ncbi:hypothetical protein A3Q56_05420 [Intoshia linei]|uniref:Uncharacterized protein n=1 Tax=Intoshia linei TaxID=1819745 RepID=A0A177AXY7_9BILA|nr:hypothetical protein A3Q56_05420 [Intoshia linei]
MSTKKDTSITVYNAVFKEYNCFEDNDDFWDAFFNLKIKISAITPILKYHFENMKNQNNNINVVIGILKNYIRILSDRDNFTDTQLENVQKLTILLINESIKSDVVYLFIILDRLKNLKKFEKFLETILQVILYTQSESLKDLTLSVLLNIVSGRDSQSFLNYR